ncbi:EamA family transporter [Streptomyces sp. NPDC057565]|uniref:EamA family transporter n=1 Tax=Streptomyces sp. NPDC057565 TaxID=3346169 RepID=UPI00368A2E17
MSLSGSASRSPTSAPRPRRRPDRWADGAESAGWLIFLGIVPTLLAYRWYFNGLTTVRSTTAAVLVLLEPATAAALAVVLGERISTPLVLGSVLLLTAIAVLSHDQS